MNQFDTSEKYLTQDTSQSALKLLIQQVGHHSSVDPSAPTFLCISTTSSLFRFIFKLRFEKDNNKTQTEAGIGTYFENKIFTFKVR